MLFAGGLLCVGFACWFCVLDNEASWAEGLLQQFHQRAGSMAAAREEPSAKKEKKKENSKKRKQEAALASNAMFD